MSFYSPPLVSLTKPGLFCSPGGFHIDPHRAVDLAVVTHAHSDHARRGSKHYLCAAPGVGLLKARLGSRISVTGVPYGEKIKLGDVTVSFHSAGHILGSAQVRMEHEGQVWVASGDYKRDPDPSCHPFEVVPCDTFITEATFGTPKYSWNKEAKHGEDLYAWWCEAIEQGKNCILFGYSLGKTQRILGELAPFAQKPILVHHTTIELTECYRQEGVNLAPTVSLAEVIERMQREGGSLQGEMILAPPSILDESWKKFLGNYETAFASGWMQGSAPFFRGGYDRGFVMSDHADWDDLNRTIDESQAKRVFVQHRNGTLIRHLRKKGIDAHPVEMLELDAYSKLGGYEMELF